MGRGSYAFGRSFCVARGCWQRCVASFLWAVVGVFGGLQVFGLIGLFLGPIIMALLVTIWREWLVDD